MGLLDPPGTSAAALAATYARKTSLATVSARTLTLPATMSSPPTITPSAGRTQGESFLLGSAITSPVGLPANTTTNKWRYLGGSALSIGGVYYKNGLLPAATFLLPTWKVEWVSDSPDFEFVYRAINTGNWRLMVDGQWANAVQTTDSSGNRFLVRVNHGTRVQRKYTLWLDLIAFGGLIVGPTDTVYQAAAPFTKAMFLGDSYTQGTGSTAQMTNWALTCGQMLGWEDIYCNGEGGTGYLNPAVSAGRAAFIDRLAAGVTPYSPNVIVIMGGYNDNLAANAGYTAAAVGTAAAALYAAIATQVPNADVFVTSLQVSQTADTTSNGYRDAMQTAALVAPNVKKFIDITSWIVGSGKAGATTGTGNADVMIASDGVHPSQTGHDYYARRMAAEIASYYFAGV